MLVIPAVVSLLAGVYVSVVYGASAYTGYVHKIDTKSEAVTFFRHLSIAIVGLTIIVTSFHSLVR